MVDAIDSKSIDSNVMRVQVSLPAHRVFELCREGHHLNDVRERLEKRSDVLLVSKTASWGRDLAE